MKLCEPITIRGVEFKNRVLMPANGVLASCLGLKGPTEAIIDFYSERASGGVGAIIIGGLPPSAFISDEDLKQTIAPRLRMEALERLVGRMHKSGTKVGVQLFHANSYPSGEVRSPFTQEWAAPSPRVEHHIPPLGQEMRQLTVQEIHKIISRFALAASRVKDSGADFVEFHLAHGHAQLSYQFFTPMENRRKDRYGGESSGRMRFGLECVKAMRKAVGEDYPILVRLGAADEAPGGVQPADAADYAVELEKATVDCLSVSIGISSTTAHANHVAPLKKSPMGVYVHMAEAVKKRVNIPVVAVGRINTPEVAEHILANGQAVLVAICRQLICDPCWVNKAVEDRAGEIVFCNSCNTYCFRLGDRTQPATHCCCKTKRPGEEWERFFPRP
jgi:2,4-dienoyl-CoA reductase (NADPH2)